MGRFGMQLFILGKKTEGLEVWYAQRRPSYVLTDIEDGITMKLELALGTRVLTASGRYHTCSVTQRDQKKRMEVL